MSISNLILLKEKMENLDESQQLDIVRILMENNIKFSENSNGVFLNLTNLKEDEIEEIKKYIQYTTDQEKNLITIENMKKEYKKNFFMDNKNTNDDEAKPQKQQAVS